MVLAKKVPDGQKLAAAKKKKKPTAVVAKKGKKVEKPLHKNGKFSLTIPFTQLIM